MAPFDEWNAIDDDDEDDVLDQSAYETRRDVILFAIDCTASMHHLYPDARDEDGVARTSNVLMALETAVQIQKKKVLVGPHDYVGVMFYNTTTTGTSTGESDRGIQLKNGTCVHQPLARISAEQVLELSAFVRDMREEPSKLQETYPPAPKPTPLGDIFTSCNWVMRDGAPKQSTKRIFLITDNDNPHPEQGPGRDRLVLTARTTLVDLVQSGITVEPFFISSDERPFDKNAFWTEVLLSAREDGEEEEGDEDEEDSQLPLSLSISRVEDLLEQMRVYEVPKRALFSINWELGEGFTIGVKGYGLVTEQKKGAYRYFADMGDHMDVVETRTAYIDEEREVEVDRQKVLYGMTLGATADDKVALEHGFGARKVPPSKRVFYTQDEVRAFRTLGLRAGLRLLGFKDRAELRFEDNVKHALFLYPDEARYVGSKRAFSALLQALARKDKIALVLGVLRANSAPTVYALLPQLEVFEDGQCVEPAGMHMIPYPFADDIRAAPVTEGLRASKELKAKFEPIVRKLRVKANEYNPDSYPNPALAFHNEQLEAAAFREEYNPAEFKDETVPNYAGIAKKAGALIEEFREALDEESAEFKIETTHAAKASSRKRKAEVNMGDDTEVRAMYDGGTLSKLTVDQMKGFLKSKSLTVGGRKAELAARIQEWFEANP